MKVNKIIYSAQCQSAPNLRHMWFTRGNRRPARNSRF